MSQREAAKKYKIPKSVIQLRVSGKLSLTHQGAGRPRTLTEEEEEHIECLISRADFGYPCDRIELMQLVGELMTLKMCLKTTRQEKTGTWGS